MATVLAPSTSQTFSLASARVLGFKKAGSGLAFLGSHELRMDAGTRCYSYGLAFTVTIVP